jgi:hypothetical protein
MFDSLKNVGVVTNFISDRRQMRQKSETKQKTCQRQNLSLVGDKNLRQKTNLTKIRDKKPIRKVPMKK